MCDEWESDQTLFSQRQVRARKEHACYACGETIRPGDRYLRTAQKDDGVFYDFHHCLRCSAIMDALIEAGADSVQYNLNCGTRYEDAFGPIPDSVARLAFMTPDEAQAIAAEEQGR